MTNSINLVKYRSSWFAIHDRPTCCNKHLGRKIPFMYTLVLVVLGPMGTKCREGVVRWTIVGLGFGWNTHEVWMKLPLSEMTMRTPCQY